jgi:hypothetical protein
MIEAMFHIYESEEIVKMIPHDHLDLFALVFSRQQTEKLDFPQKLAKDSET